MFSEDSAVRVVNLSKCYQIYDTPRDRLKQFVLPWLQKLIRRTSKQYFQEFWALKDVSFEVKKGETVGIIGRNGSGKSTLLQMICGTLNPTAGRVETHGRIAALLELGSGFNPEFTGRDNVFINGALLGLSRDEIADCFDDIINFAEIGAFIDQPVKTYSSGMFTRLAFSVAVAVRPDLLIVDEALSVGDVFFQQKCFAKIRQLQAEGTTLLFVSHDPSSIKLLCDRSILIDSGRVVSIGNSNTVVNDYIRKLSNHDNTQDNFEREAKPSLNPEVTNTDAEYRYGDQRAAIRHYEILINDQAVRVIPLNEHFQIKLALEFNAECSSPVLAYYIKDRRGIEMYSGNTHYLNSEIGPRNAGDSVLVSFSQKMTLAPGEYTLSFGLSDYLEGVSTPLDRRYDCVKFAVVTDRTVIGLVDLCSEVSIQV